MIKHQITFEITTNNKRTIRELKELAKNMIAEFEYDCFPEYWEDKIKVIKILTFKK